MVLLKVIRVMILAAYAIGGIMMEVKREALQEYADICNNVTSIPFFDRSMVVKKTWIVYYAWNIRMNNACPEFTFKYPNNVIIDRVHKAMSGSLSKEPPWHDAVLVMIIAPNREMLLFDDQSGVPGRFLGVPNMREKDLNSMFRKGDKVPLFEMAMKLTHKGRYLISSDCRLGVTSLAIRNDRKTTRVEIDTIASAMNFGDGFPACTNGPNDKQNQ